ncbi:MAG TPA: heavy metal translocating P-type ATPase [Kofleriaceae bacterium]
MTCAACVRRVERAVSALPGVSSAEVNLPLSRARIVIDPNVASPTRAAAAIRDAGYEVPDDVLSGATTGESRLAAIEHAEQAEVSTLRRDATIAIALTIPLLAIAMTHGLFAGTASVITQLVLGSIVVLVPGRHYFRRGALAVRHGSPDMNTLIALGAGAAWLSSTIVAARWLAGPRHHMPAIYFEAGAAIVAFVMIGKLLESRARARLSLAVRGLLSLAPARARLRVADATESRDEEVEAATLAPGDLLIVRPGERLAADGTVVEGASAVDEAMLTGESMPVDKTEGSPAYAGTLNHTGALVVRVARAGADTALARIARAVEDAQGQKAPIARLADRVSAVFVPAVLAIAGVTFAAWLIAGVDATVALERMIAVLVIACPCALGLATPAAVAVGTARGAELGVLFKGGGALEVASRIDVVCLDKTGTLTTGSPKVIEVSAVDGTSDDLLRLAASVEQRSEHPIARAIVDAARQRGLALATATDVVADPGRGIRATVDGHIVRVGTEEYLALAGIEPPRRRERQDQRAHTNLTSSSSLVAVDDKLVGEIAVADPPAEGARHAIDELRALGVEPVMITGDREGAARWIADQVGITKLFAETKPTAKAALVAQQREGGHRVAMVGDGINDAPALAAADLGVALGSGTDIAAAAADVTLLRGGITALPTALSLARATLHTIRRNLFAAFAYNVVCIPIAAGALYPVTGWLLSPVLASAAMSLSSVSVLLSSLRLRSWQR